MISANKIASPDPSTFPEEVLTSHKIVSIIEGLKLDKVWGGGGSMGCLSEEYCVLRDSAQGVSEMRIALENRQKYCLQISALWTSEYL